MNERHQIKELPQRARAKDISKFYNVSLSTVWNYSAQGYLTPIRITRGVTCFDRTEVQALFDGKKFKEVTS